MGDTLLTTLRCEIGEEFPSIDETPDVLVARNYEYDTDPYWIADPDLFEEE